MANVPKSTINVGICHSLFCWWSIQNEIQIQNISFLFELKTRGRNHAKFGPLGDDKFVNHTFNSMLSLNFNEIGKSNLKLIQQIIQIMIEVQQIISIHRDGKYEA